jgi:hypothetical protein
MYSYFWLFVTLTIAVQLTEKFGLAKVKDMLKDIVNNCYDHALEKQKTEVRLCLNVVSPLPQALMFLSTRVTSGLASCPSVHVSVDLLFAFAQSK